MIKTKYYVSRECTIIFESLVRYAASYAEYLIVVRSNERVNSSTDNCIYHYFTRWSIKSKIRSRLKSGESPFRLAEKLNWTHGFQRLAFLQLVVALHCGQCMERDRHVPRKNRVASRRVERSVFLSFFLPPPSVSSVAQFVVSSRFYESNKLYLAAGHGRWVMGVRRGRRSVFLSLSVCLSPRVVRRKSTQDHCLFRFHHGRTFSTNNTNPVLSPTIAGMEISRFE